MLEMDRETVKGKSSKLGGMKQWMTSECECRRTRHGRDGASNRRSRWQTLRQQATRDFQPCGAMGQVHLRGETLGLPLSPALLHSPERSYTSAAHWPSIVPVHPTSLSKAGSSRWHTKLSPNAETREIQPLNPRTTLSTSYAEA